MGRNFKKDVEDTNKVKVLDLMTGFEARTNFGYKRTAADNIKSGQLLKDAVNRKLGSDVTLKMKDGTAISVPAVDLLVDAKYQADLLNPGNIDLVKWAKAAGEDETKVDVSGSLVDEDLRKRALK